MERRLTENIPILGRVQVNLVDLASRIYNIYLSEKEVERQQSSAHLGLISKAFQGINHSRYDYLILQCVISEIADNTFKGTTVSQGSININGKKYIGNDIIKSWFLLSNFGHCKNTIADEKALLLKAVQRKGFKSYLVNCIKDEQLRDWSEKTINDFDYVNFHHILSLRRIYKCLPRLVDFQNEIISVYKLLLLDINQTRMISDPKKVEQLKIIHRNVRNLGVIALDTRNSSLPVSIDILSAILSFDFYDGRYQQSKASDIFNPILSLLYKSLYLDPKSQTYQRSYEISGLNNMTGSFSDIIELATNEGLANPNSTILHHFLRIELHINNLEDEDTKDALRSILTVKRGVNSVESSMDYNPFTSIRVMDFYLIPQLFKLKHLPKFLSNISGILEKQVQGTYRNHVKHRGEIVKGVKRGITKAIVEEDQKEIIIDSLTNSIFEEAWREVQTQNIPPFKDILWAVLRYHIDDKFFFDIDHHTETEFKYFGIILPSGLDLLNPDITSAIESTSDHDRKHELKQLQKSTSKKFNGTTIACIARITIYDYSKAPEHRIVTDIDSLVLKFNDKNMYLELHESKNTKNPYTAAKKDINKKLIRILNKNCIGRQIREVKGYGAKVLIKHDS
ncbi:hypothetical protein SAMN04488062_101352 [Flavobacterium omnivorum]|uniref:Uncharacterized protein n=1 Tax=Flavobacterium omnivorum TaxID=178355 RepID=A0A1G7W760_9FLAO|nr:hypothetical protein [Flavobacterium omnivorum]SDG67768.1 hypothetical protein SAMN04488062_101352 [Flavobacterium omnivorum]